MLFTMTVTFEWCGAVRDEEINQLHAEGFDHAYVGFVNVIWDGQTHAFVEDTLVAHRSRRQGIGKKLLTVATEHSKGAGCEWLHVDFDDHLKSFYFDACGFRPTNAGLINLR